MKREVDNPEKGQDMDYSKEVGKRIKQWRLHLGFKNQVPFSELLGLHISVLKKYETGRSIPRGDSLRAFANTGVNINWLLTGEGDIEANTKQSNPSPIPKELEDYTDRLNAIHGLLAMMDDNKRESVLDEIFTRVQEIKRIDELEQMVRKLNQDRKSS